MAVLAAGAGGAVEAQGSPVIGPRATRDSAAALAPIVLNATASAAAGDVVGLQGENFGNAPRVYLVGAGIRPLEIVNSVPDHWVAVRIPATAKGAVRLRVDNRSGLGTTVLLNGAVPWHLDALQLVPGGVFRVFGRNLRVAGSTPRIMVDGVAATIDLSRSDESTLTARAPRGLTTKHASVVTVDNGNGSGSAALGQRVEVLTMNTGDPFSLGVGWGAGFVPVAQRVVDAGLDPRLVRRMACDGLQDDAPALQAAIDLAAAEGGAVVRLPGGKCRLASSIALRSGVVMQGVVAARVTKSAPGAATELIYEANYPIAANRLDLCGMSDLTLTNAGSATEGPLIKDSSRVFMRRVHVRLNTSRQMYFSGNRDMAVIDSEFTQSGSISHQGPYTFYNSAGLLFEGNTTRWVDGAPNLLRVHDSYLHGNRYTRDAGAVDDRDSGDVHSFVIGFAYRIAVIGNTFDVVHGPVVSRTRNDGETILTEGGGDFQSENLGSVSSAGPKTLTDPANTLAVDPFHDGAIPENYGVAIVAGKGAGQTRHVVAYERPTLTIDHAWDIVPDATSRYATFVWGLEQALIKDNRLLQNPRGIWLYQTAIREVDVIGNHISEGGGIYLRAFQNLSKKQFMPIYGVRIARNRIFNARRQWGSYINTVFVNTDALAFGIAMLGIEVRENDLTANVPNLELPTEENAGTEGYANKMRVENIDRYESSSTPRLLGTIFTHNRCTHCEKALRIGTGAGGTTSLRTRLVHAGVAVDDSPASAKTTERSVHTVIR